jgi:hypothetical protein
MAPMPLTAADRRKRVEFASAAFGRYSVAEIAELLGVSRWALVRELRRFDRERDREFEERVCDYCGEPLPSFVTARRRFCDDHHRVMFSRKGPAIS